MALVLHQKTFYPPLKAIDPSYAKNRSSILVQGMLMVLVSSGVMAGLMTIVLYLHPTHITYFDAPNDSIQLVASYVSTNTNLLISTSTFVVFSTLGLLRVRYFYEKENKLLKQKLLHITQQELNDAFTRESITPADRMYTKLQNYYMKITLSIILFGTLLAINLGIGLKSNAYNHPTFHLSKATITHLQELNKLIAEMEKSIYGPYDYHYNLPWQDLLPSVGLRRITHYVQTYQYTNVNAIPISEIRLYPVLALFNLCPLLFLPTISYFSSEILGPKIKTIAPDGSMVTDLTGTVKIYNAYLQNDQEITSDTTGALRRLAQHNKAKALAHFAMIHLVESSRQPQYQKALEKLIREDAIRAAIIRQNLSDSGNVTNIIIEYTLHTPPYDYRIRYLIHVLGEEEMNKLIKAIWADFAKQQPTPFITSFFTPPKDDICAIEQGHDPFIVS